MAWPQRQESVRTLEQAYQQWVDVFEKRLPGRLVLIEDDFQLRWHVDRYDIARMDVEYDDEGRIGKSEIFVAFYPASYPACYHLSGSHSDGPHLFHLVDWCEEDNWVVDCRELPRPHHLPRRVRLERLVSPVDDKDMAFVREAQDERDEGKEQEMRRIHRALWAESVREWEPVEERDVEVLGEEDQALVDQFIRVSAGKEWTEISVCEISWDSPHTPTSRWLPVTRLIPETPQREVDRTVQGLLKKSRFFRVCSRCKKRNPMGWMLDEETCQSCAEKEGVVF